MKATNNIQRTAAIVRIFSILVIVSLCLVPVLASQPVLAGPPPGSTASTAFTGSSSSTPSGTSTATATSQSTTVSTDKFKYYHDETAAITGGGFTPGSTVSVKLTTPEGKTSSWSITADASGNIATNYNMGASTEGAYTLQLTDGTNSATTMFTDPVSTAILYPTANVNTNLTRYYPLFGTKPNPNQNWNYVDDPVSSSGNPATGNDGYNSVVYSGITGDHYGHDTPVSDIYQFSNLPGGFQLYTTSGSLQTPTPSSTSGQQTGHWTNNNKVVMQWNSVPSGTVTSNPTVTVTTVCRENGIFPDGYVRILLQQPGGSTYTYTPAQGSALTDNWKVYSITLNNAPDGSAWATNNINSLQGGVSLSQLGSLLGWAGMTQMYMEVAPGVMAPVLSNYNYHWDSSSNTSTTGTTTPQITLTDGTHTFYVNAQDTGGGTTSYGSSGVYLIDTKSPTLSKLINGTAVKSGWYNATDAGAGNQLNVVLNADDSNGSTPVSGVNNIVYKVGSGTANTVYNTSTTGATGDGKSATQSVSFVISTSGGANQGAVTLQHSANDVAGNTGSSPAGSSQTIYVDTQSPLLTRNLSGTTGNKGWYKSSSVGVTLNASDATSGVDNIQYSVNGGATQTATNTNVVDPASGAKSTTHNTSTSINTQGVNTISHIAHDVAGNSSANNPNSDASPTTVKIDSGSPLLTRSVTGTSGNNGWFTSSNVGITLNASDTVSGVDNIQYTVNSNPAVTVVGTEIDSTNHINSSSLSTTANINTQGVNTISHVAYDVAGNSSTGNPASSASPLTVKIDSGSPLLSKNLSGTAGDHGWYRSAVDVTLNASDATSGVDTIQYSVNGGATQTATNTNVINAANSIKSSTFSTGTTINTEGSNTISHTAYDMAGNSSVNNPGSAISPQTINIDTVAPTLVKTINSAAPRSNTVNNGWYNASDAPSGTLTVKLAANDATSGVQNISYTMDGSSNTVTNPSISGATASSSMDTTFTISKQGTTILTHQSKDMAGNTYVLTVQDVKLDTILPTLVKSVSRTGLDQVTVTLTGNDDTSGSGINNITYSSDGGTAVTVNGNGDFSKLTSFVITGTGAHDLTHNIIDIAGNQFVLANQTVNIGGSSGNTGANNPNNSQSVLTVSLQNGPVAAFPVTPSGTLISDADVSSPDGMVIVSIPAGTTILNSDGTPVYLNRDPDIFSIAASTTNAPNLPSGYQMVSSYEMSPSGLTFDSPITLAINYQPDKMPSGKQAVIAFYDDTASKWIDLETAGYIAADGGQAAHTAAARVNHFTRFAVMAK